jgi:hypothetical protein
MTLSPSWSKWADTVTPEDVLPGKAAVTMRQIDGYFAAVLGIPTARVGRIDDGRLVPDLDTDREGAFPGAVTDAGRCLEILRVAGVAASAEE